MLSRSTFKKPSYVHRRVYPSPIPPEKRRNAVMAPSVAHEAIEKENAVRHEGYRRLVAARPCIHCGKVGRSQHAHENAGKGKGIKVDDRRAMPLCADEPGLRGCHSRFDAYELLPGGRLAHIEAGRMWSALTRDAIQADGLWPADLPTWRKA